MAALYRAADVMVVTPFRDGMNLVAKEYVACRYDDDGALVLSEFAGAADELRQAWLVNPYDIDGMKAALLEAFAADEKERARRMRAMRKTVVAPRRRPRGPTPSSASSSALPDHHDKTVRPARRLTGLSGRRSAAPPVRRVLGHHDRLDLRHQVRARGAASRRRSRRPRASPTARPRAVEEVDVARRDQAGVHDPDGLGDLEQVAAQRA